MIQLARCFSIVSITICIILGIIFPGISPLPQRSGSEFIHQRILRSQRIQKCGRSLMNIHQLVCSGAAPSKRNLNEDAWLLQDLGSWPKQRSRSSGRWSAILKKHPSEESIGR
uniref:Uncharacterized protein n=1 Tax=Tetranychus urticae TaxID=32264 RepID=T1KFJ1_TETUR